MPYQFQPFPTWRYKVGEAPLLVRSQAELDALGPGWGDVPVATPPGPGVVSVSPGPMPGERTKTIVLKPDSTLASFSIPEFPLAGSLEIWWNGLSLSPGEDFTFDGGKLITFVGDVPSFGDVVKFRYRY